MPAAIARRGELYAPDSIPDVAARLRAGTLTVTALVAGHCERIRRMDPALHALITFTESAALETAARLDAELASGRDRGPLHGIPIVHKDLFDTRGIVTTIGSGRFRKRVPDADATVVARLHQAGTVLLGKASMTEFATHPSGRNREFGDVRNPHAPERSAGGSSGGTAAAIAAGYCLGGTGSDTGGSVRIPASWCGIVGLRPTFGLVSMSGAHPRAHSLDVCGPMARSARDCALLLNAMAGHDPAYRYSIDAPVRDYATGIADAIDGVRIGIVEDFTWRDVDADVAAAVQRAADILAGLGARIESVRLPMLDEALRHTTLLDVLFYEFNQILGNDYRADPARDDVYGEVVKANVRRGEAVSRQAYERSIADRPWRTDEFRQVFRRVDALLTPSVPFVAPLLSAGDEAWDRTRQFTLPFSFLGVPAISVPCGTSTAGLPIGMQLVADHLGEPLLLRLAHAFERAS